MGRAPYLLAIRAVSVHRKLRPKTVFRSPDRTKPRYKTERNGQFSNTSRKGLSNGGREKTISSRYRCQTGAVEKGDVNFGAGCYKRIHIFAHQVLAPNGVTRLPAIALSSLLSSAWRFAKDSSVSSVCVLGMRAVSCEGPCVKLVICTVMPHASISTANGTELLRRVM
jgi:hypothetical protein